MEKVYSSYCPASYTIDKIDKQNSNIRFYTNITQVDELDMLFDSMNATNYSSDVYVLKVQNRDNLNEYVRDNYDYLLSLAKAEDNSKKAEEIRKLRDSLLQESDKQVLLDRIGLAVPSGDTFTAWKPFLGKLASMLSGDWATYRQALRDIPAQEGFPYDIVWPTKPID